MTVPTRTIAAALGSLTLATGLAAAVPTSATAAGATCQGKPATITVTRAGVDAVGTEGDDVMAISGGTGKVDGRGGNDLICLVPGDYNSNVYFLDAGTGDDVVDTSAMGAEKNSTDYVNVDLGAGSDRFVGGPADETVSADGEGSAEDDVISTGTGGDVASSGTHGHPNGDTVDLGPGDDRLGLRGSHVTGTFDGGADRTVVVVGDPTGRYDIDVASGSVRRDGIAWSPIAGTLDFQITDYASLVYVGTDGPDGLDLPLGTGTGTRSIDLRGGDDAVHLERAPREGDVLVGGPGSDRITFFSPGSTIELDLGAGVLDLAHASGTPYSVSTPGFEHATVAGKDVTVLGTAGPNSIFLVGCRVRALGGAGRDQLMHGKDYYYEENDLYRCSDAVAALDGGAGNDRIWGNYGDDLLRGGGGNDKIEGRAGDDRMWGGSGHDVITGDDYDRGKKNSKDRIWGGRGNDKLLGMRGNDQLRGGPGRDVTKGGAGRDLCRAEKKRTCER